MVLHSCFLGQTSTCGISLFLKCVLVNCLHDKYGLRRFCFQGFLAHHISIQPGHHPGCLSFLWVSAIVFFCSTRIIDLPWFSFAVSSMVRCVVRSSFATSEVSFGVCEVCGCKHLNR